MSSADELLACIDNLKLSPLQKVILHDRLLKMITKMERKTRRYRRYNAVGSIVVNMGSLLTPALLSIKADDHQSIIYHVTWTTALLTAIGTSLMSLFQVQKRFVLFIKTLEKLKSESFLYFSLTACYNNETHASAFHTFIEKIEVIFASEVSSEFKQGHHATEDPAGTHNAVKRLVKTIHNHTDTIDEQLISLDVKEVKESKIPNVVVEQP
tara:strand:- start:704 stop:1336 length:633 start_codon:yes stop_codon:yes gene_type:complete